MRRRAAVAVFAILLNTVLVPAWGIASAEAGPPGDIWSICLAEAGADHENRPAAPVERLHCYLCLLPGPAAAAAIAPVPAILPLPPATRIHYGVSHRAFVALRAGDAFDARAPPARSTPA